MGSREKKVKVTARVRVVLDIPVWDTWGGDCPLSQVQKQAAESALGMLHDSGGELNGLFQRGVARLVGEPEVTAVIVEEDRS